MNNPITHRTGWVYLLEHPSNSGLLKIGFTERTVEERIAELESATGAIPGYLCSYAVLNSSPAELEKAIHQRFSNTRTWKNKEFFTVEKIEVAIAIEEICLSKDIEIYKIVDREKLQQKAQEARLLREVAQKKAHEVEQTKLKSENKARKQKEEIRVSTSIDNFNAAAKELTQANREAYSNIKNSTFLNKFAYTLVFSIVPLGISASILDTWFTDPIGVTTLTPLAFWFFWPILPLVLGFIFNNWISIYQIREIENSHREQLKRLAEHYNISHDTSDWTQVTKESKL